MLSKLRVGQKLNDLLVLDSALHRLIKVSSRASLKKAKQKNIPPVRGSPGGLPVTGFVRNITPDGVFVEFLGGITGLFPAVLSKMPTSSSLTGLTKAQTIAVNVQSVDQNRHSEYEACSG